MTFTDSMRTVLVNQKPITVPEHATGNEIMLRAGIDPGTRDLVYDGPDEVIEMVPKNSRIRTVNGQSFDTQIPSSGGK